MSFEGRVRGVHFTRALKYVKKKRGIIGLNKFLEYANTTLSLSPPLTEQKYEEKGWYRYEEYLDILDAIDDHFGTGDRSVIYDIGISTQRQLEGTRKPIS